MEARRTHFSAETRRVAVELWLAKVSLAKIREPLQMSKATLKRVLAHARAHPEQSVQKRRKGSGGVSKVMKITLQAMKRHLNRDPTLSAKQLKALVPALESLSIRSIQMLCAKNLNLPSRKMAAKPLLTQAMRDKRLAFCQRY
jgi:hypothetical protein